MKSKAFIIAGLILFCLCGCGPKSKVVGLWEFDADATQAESPIPVKELHYRLRFRKDQVISQDIDGYFSICAWKWGEFDGDSSDLPPYIQNAQRKGHQIYINQLYYIFHAAVLRLGFGHPDDFYTSFGYFNKKNQLVLYDPNRNSAVVFNRVD